jgi:hypothetical protein
MSRVEIFEKMLPDCLWLQGYLTDRKHSPEQYKTSGKFKEMRTKFAEPFSWKCLAYSWGVGDKRTRSVLASLNKPGMKEGSFVPGNVIDCARTARAKYTPDIMFVQCRVIEMKGGIENLAYKDMMSQNSDFHEKAKLEWIKLLDNEKANWVAIAQEHDEIQPYI